MYILGISAFYHDSAATLIYNDKILAAAQEERYTRQKHTDSFPKNAIEFCLNKAHIKLNEVSAIAFYDKPLLKFERLLETYYDFAPKGIVAFLKAMPIWLKEKLFLKKIIIKELEKISDQKFDTKKIPILFPEHHLSHAASAFYPSPFEEAAFLTVDGVGEHATTTYGIGKNNEMTMFGQINFPHSLGLLYSAFTYYTGFKVNSGEYKLMGLAPYGKPIYQNLIKEKLIEIKNDGSFALNMEYFGYATGLRMTNEKFNQLFGAKPRQPEQKLTQKEMDLAASVQAVTEEMMLLLAKNVRKETNQKNLVLAGGVALNCVANGKIWQEKIFDKIWVQPAAGDAGGSLGAALAAYHIFYQKPRTLVLPDKMNAALLGDEFSDLDIENVALKFQATYQRYDDEQLFEKIAQILANGNVVGWFQGRMEFGPRALGNRSILGDARNPEMQKKMNLKIKFRESFRPFAPIVLQEEVSNYFEYDDESPYMLMVAKVKPERRRQMNETEKSLFGIEQLNVLRSDIPAVTHIDYSARLQTVDNQRNPKLYQLLKSFQKLTNCAVLVNTSFNVRSEPIVRTPEEAYRCLMRTNMDFLVMNNYVFEKTQQIHYVENEPNWAKKFELD